MLWDYAETDPVGSGPGNLWKKLDRIVQGARYLSHLPGRVQVEHGCAQSLPFEDATFDAVVTDPPYYDNIFYSVLADFFYSWKRLLLKHLEPDLFSAPTTNFDSELVASSFRNGGSDRAHERYCQELSLALTEAARVLRPSGVLAFVYSHSSLAGWEALVRAFCGAPLVVTGVQPLSIERRQRPRAMSSEAVNTCMVFVARKEPVGDSAVTPERAIRRFSDVCQSEIAAGLLASGWSSEDAALALYANAVALLANSGPDTPPNTIRTFLGKAEEMVQDKFHEFRIVRRKSL